MDVPEFVETPLRLALLLAGLLLPGSMLLRALRLPWSLAAAFTASCGTLYVVVLALACTGGPISLVTLAGALGLVALAARFVPARKTTAQLASSFSCFSQMGWWLPLYLVFWAIVAYRLGTQPLSGPDVGFRWSHLAEQMLTYRTLDFYPPRSGTDFVRYFWAESIPPGIASLYAWAYACGGSTNALWTSPVVALQLLCLHEVVWRLGSRWGGEIVARRAVLLAAACPLLTWSFLIGQETGLAALAVGGLAWSLQHLGEADGRRWAVLAGIFAIVAASTREYGPAFAIAAVLGAILQGGSRRQTVLLALVALPVAAIWPVRVWSLTGNPFYSLDLGGLFPVNPVFAAWSGAFHAPHASALATTGDGRTLMRYLGLWALPATAGLVALAILLGERLREARTVALLAGCSLLLWWWSLPHTAGGLFYSLRVLSPAFGLLVVCASYSLGRLAPGRIGRGVFAAAIALMLLESLPKTLVLPENPYQLAARDWLQAGRKFVGEVQEGESELVTKLGRAPGHERILSDNAGLPRALAKIGGTVLPLWSPDVAWLFDHNLRPEEIARRWKQAGFRYLVLAKSGPTPEFLRTEARWNTPYFTLLPATFTRDYVILEAIAAESPSP